MEDFNYSKDKETIIVADVFENYNGCVYEKRGFECIHVIREEFCPNFPNFSEDITEGVYLGHTVVYDIAIQLAAYMGVKEIYLLGVDNSYVKDIKKGHFIKNYYSDNSIKKYKLEAVNDSGWQERTLKAYEKAEIYSRGHGFRIYNATRGGKLEVFERVDFDSLF